MSWEGQSIGFKGLVLVVLGLIALPACGNQGSEHPQDERPHDLNDEKTPTFREGVDQSYAGPYASDERYLTILREMPSTRAFAIEQAQQRLDVRLDEKEKEQLVIGFSHLPETRGKTTRHRQGGKLYHVIVLDVPWLVSGTGNLEQTVLHESIHGIMRVKMGYQFDRLPEWLKEGSAVWGADQIRTKLKESLLYYDDASVPLNGLGTKPHTERDYTEDGLAFLFLETEHGLKSVHRAMRKITQGTNYRTALLEETSVSWKQFIQDAEYFSHQYVSRELREAGYANYQTASQAYQERNLAQATVGFENFLHAHPESMLAPRAMYELADAQFDLGRYREAEVTLHTMLAQFPGDKFRMSARHLLGMTYSRMEDWEKVKEQFEILLQDPYAVENLDFMGGAYYFIGRVHLHARDFASARQAFAKVLEVGGDYVEDGWYYLGETLYQSGDLEKAEVTFQELLKRYPDSGLREHARTYLKLILDER